jgi:urease accessory protein
MQLIHDHLSSRNGALPTVALWVERGILAKRRWRGRAEDGTEFGFDLGHALADGDAFFASEHAVYLLKQLPEPVLEVELGEDAPACARLGWIIGNLHFQIAIEGRLIRVVDDPAIRQLLHREQIPFKAAHAVFHPLSGGHSHDH